MATHNDDSDISALEIADLEMTGTIVLSPEDYDHFVEMCNTKDPVVSERLREAAERLDRDGYVLRRDL